jgi:hypothetical protein
MALGGGLLGAFTGAILCNILAVAANELVPLLPSDEDDIGWFLLGVLLVGGTVGAVLGVVIAAWAPRKVRSVALGTLAGCAVGFVLHITVNVIAISDDSNAKGKTLLARYPMVVGPALLFGCAGLGGIAALLPRLFPRSVIAQAATQRPEASGRQERESTLREAPSTHIVTRPR